MEYVDLTAELGAPPRAARPVFPRKATAFGPVLKAAREAKGLGLRELAEQVQTSASNLCCMESGRRRAPELSQVRAIARALDADEEELVRAAAQDRKLVCPHCGEVVAR